MEEKKENFGLSTRAIHAGGKVDDSTRALKIPIWASNTFSYKDMNEFFMAAVNAYSAKLDDFSYFYTRTANPTTNALEQKLASVIGCEGTIATVSGMAAIAFAFIANYRENTKILSSNSVYRSTDALVSETLPKMGVRCDYSDFRDLSSIEKLLKKNTYSIVHFESPANPTLRCYDIKAICDLIHEYDAETKVTFDNTFATPICQQPLKLGVDYEIHSLSKYVNGHGDALGGCIASNDSESLADFRRHFAETLGQVPSPFNSFLLLRGLKTIDLRVNEQCKNAFTIAKYLEEHEIVTRVFYPGLSSHPEHEIAITQMDPFGGMIAFELENEDKVREFLNNRLSLIRLAMDLGDIQSLVEWPYIMTHYDLDYDLKMQIGVTEQLVRLSVGIENVEDLIKDLDQALKGCH